MSTRSDRIATEEGESKLNCRGTDCAKDKHSYLPAPKPKHLRRKLLQAAGMADSKAALEPFGSDLCWACGDGSIPWEQTRMRDQSQISETVALLKRELIRYIYWTRSFDEKALKSARRVGANEVLARIPKRIQSTFKLNHPRENMQTPWDGDVLYYAQHATATCCRRCLAQWHGYPFEALLDDGASSYIEQLMRFYLLERQGEIWEPDDE